MFTPIPLHQSPSSPFLATNETNRGELRRKMNNITREHTPSLHKNKNTKFGSEKLFKPQLNARDVYRDI